MKLTSQSLEFIPYNQEVNLVWVNEINFLTGKNQASFAKASLMRRMASTMFSSLVA